MGSRSASFTTDFEDVFGRTTYASQCAGGYYAVRLAVLEALAREQRQYSVLVLRFIDDTYTTPLGVWVVRETLRHMLQEKPQIFDSSAALVNFALLYVHSHWQSCLDSFLPQSHLLRLVRTQKKLFEF